MLCILAISLDVLVGGLGLEEMNVIFAGDDFEFIHKYRVVYAAGAGMLRLVGHGLVDHVAQPSP